jgi:uncharacterized membrane protein
MIPYTQDLLGGVHLITAMLSLLFGTIVILQTKGTRRHKLLGYGYAISMVFMLITSLLIYRLFGGFGLFHIFSIIALVTLLGGMIPAIRRKPAHWVVPHFSFMYWSVIGLYAAFASEIFTRIPDTPFFGMVGIATFLVIALGYLFWFRNKSKWSKQFLKLPPKSTS